MENDVSLGEDDSPDVKWHPHERPDYDTVLSSACPAELSRLLSAAERERVPFLKDPRDVHRRLYAQLAPENHPEYAGTYRGTKSTTLEHRRVGALQVGECAGPAAFIEPEKVEQSLVSYRQAVETLLDGKIHGDGLRQFDALAKIFYVFGLIHPFLDGNGHVQRLIFAVAVSMCDRITLRNTWTIHPRPYDIEMAEAFNRKDARLQAVADVLRTYVDIL